MTLFVKNIFYCLKYRLSNAALGISGCKFVKIETLGIRVGPLIPDKDKIREASLYPNLRYIHRFQVDPTDVTNAASAERDDLAIPRPPNANGKCINILSSFLIG
jgi:hypothetical protein